MNTQAITEAAEAWATRWADDMLAVNVGPALTCNEADAVAALLHATGRAAEAEEFLIQHGASDDQLDAHYPRCRRRRGSGPLERLPARPHRATRRVKV